MKIIISEEMLKEIVKGELNEWKDYGLVNARTQTVSPAVNMSNFSNFIPKTAQNQQTRGTQQTQTYNTPTNLKLGNWDIAKSIGWIVSHTGNKSNHKCATYVEDAIAAGGLPRMSCSENGGDGYAHSLHHRGTLRKYGFNIVDSGRLAGMSKYQGNLQPGDIIVLDTYILHKNHIAMWTGNQWVSDFKQVNANVYTVPADFWIYRYSGGRQNVPGQQTQQQNTTNQAKGYR